MLRRHSHRVLRSRADYQLVSHRRHLCLPIIRSGKGAGRRAAGDVAYVIAATVPPRQASDVWRRRFGPHPAPRPTTRTLAPGRLMGPLPRPTSSRKTARVSAPGRDLRWRFVHCNPGATILPSVRTPSHWGNRYHTSNVDWSRTSTFSTSSWRRCFFAGWGWPRPRRSGCLGLRSGSRPA